MFLDTAGLVCYFDQADARHAEARAYFAAARRRLTHSYVLAEFVPLCHARKLNRAAALTFMSDLLASPVVEIVWVDRDLHLGAFSLLQARLDKAYSLCDAVSFLLMKQRGITEALTTDHHFEQEGLRRLLLPWWAIHRRFVDRRHHRSADRGLSAAIALQRVGIAVTVFERAGELREVGAGIALWANAVRALERLGLREAVEAAGLPLERAQMRTASGELLKEIAGTSPRVPAPERADP